MVRIGDCQGGSEGREGNLITMSDISHPNF